MIYLVDPKKVYNSKCLPVCLLAQPLYGVPLCRQIAY